MSSDGFSLVELLVVVAIIVILASILFPVFARARENARRTSCQSNLKQIGLGLAQYTQDYDEQLVRAYYGSNNGGPSDATTNYKWMDAIQPYVKNGQLFTCPSQSNFSSTSNGPYEFRGGSKYGSYVINATYWALGDGLTSPAGEYVSLSSAATPSTTVWVTDGDGRRFEFAWQNVASTPSITTSNPRQLSTIIERHLNTTNVLYVDGHVKAVHLDALAKIGNNGAYSPLTLEDD